MKVRGLFGVKCRGLFHRNFHVYNNPLKYADPTGQYGVEYIGLAMFVVGSVVGHSLDYAINKESRQGDYGETLKYSVSSAYNGFNQCMGMYSTNIYHDEKGNSSWGVNIGITFGSGGIGLGLTGYYNYTYKYANGTQLTLGVAVGSDLNRSGPSLINTQGSIGGGFEYGTESFHGGLYSTTYISGSSSQRIGGITFGGKNWSVAYENDGGLLIKELKLGDGGDEYRTAALRFRFKKNGQDYSLGFNLMTEERVKSYNAEEKDFQFETVDGWVNRKDLNSSMTYKTIPSGRLGGIYVGHGNNYFGVNSDGVRNYIQNERIHKCSLIDSPLFINYDYGTTFYGGTWQTRPYSLW